MGAIDPWGMASLVLFEFFLRPSQQLWPAWNPRERLAGLMKGTTRQCYRQNIQAVGLMIEKKIFFKVFPNYKSTDANKPQVWPNKDTSCGPHE